MNKVELAKNDLEAVFRPFTPFPLSCIISEAKHRRTDKSGANSACLRRTGYDDAPESGKPSRFTSACCASATHMQCDRDQYAHASEDGSIFSRPPDIFPTNARARTDLKIPGSGMRSAMPIFRGREFSDSYARANPYSIGLKEGATLQRKPSHFRNKGRHDS